MVQNSEMWQGFSGTKKVVALLWISEKNTFKKLKSGLIWSFFVCNFKVKFLNLPKWNGTQVGRK